jgi:hypothetical protein
LVERPQAVRADARAGGASSARWAATAPAEPASERRASSAADDGGALKSRKAFAMLYDHYGADPNPVRDKRVKLPDERKQDLIVPLAVHVEAVADVLPRQYLVPYLVIDWTGLRLSALEEARVRELDEHRQAFLACASVAKNEKPIWLALHDVLFAATVAGLPPREDRDLDAQLFPGFVGANLRTAITRACRPAHRTSHGTACASGAGRCSPSRATRWPRSPSGSATPRSSPPSTTCSPSATTPRWTTRPCSTAEREGAGRPGVAVCVRLVCHRCAIA